MAENLSKLELIEILGGIHTDRKSEVEGFCIKNSSKEDFEEAWKESRRRLEEDPHYYEEIN